MPMSDRETQEIEERLRRLPQEIVDRVLPIMKAAVETEREACAKIAEERKTYYMPIPCPDNKPGCAVAHSVSGTRDKIAGEIADEIRSRQSRT